MKSNKNESIKGFEMPLVKFSKEQNERPLNFSQQALVMSCERMAYKEASKFADQMIVSRPWLDKIELTKELTSAALFGLVIAAQRYDESMGYAFTTYAWQYIRNLLEEESRNWHPLGRTFMKAHQTDMAHCDVSRNLESVRWYDPEPDDHCADRFLLHVLEGETAAAVRLRYIEEFSFKEIAERLGMTLWNAKRAVSTGIKKLRATPFAYFVLSN